jgi:predicted enzyme related to lactoylglutathione lyase
MPVTVSETFLSISVCDMERATAFYMNALGATVLFTSPRWSSVTIAGVRIGLALVSKCEARHTGLHFAVSDLAAACAEVERAGGRTVRASVEVAPGVVVADVEDSEGNVVVLTQR